MTAQAEPPSWCWPPGQVPGCARTPPRCCTRWAGAACWRTPCTRWPRSPRSTWSWCSATTASASPRPSPSWPTTWAAPIDVAVQEQQLGTGHAVGCGLAALPADFAGTVVVTSGDVPLLDADTLADLIATHSAETGRGDRADHHAARPDRLRPHPAHPGRRGHRHRRSRPTPARSQRAITEVNSGVYAFDIAALRSALTGCARTTPSRSST